MILNFSKKDYEIDIGALNQFTVFLQEQIIELDTRFQIAYKAKYWSIINKIAKR